ncbi:MAG: EAL domain-containing protein [Pseudomonadota bacterium]
MAAKTAQPQADAARDPLHMAAQMRDQDTLKMVRNALERRNAMLAFQPVVQSRNHEKPAFYEGLIRVLDETGRIIPARDFIDVVETQELGRQLDCMALELGLHELAAEPDLRLAINMSARSVGYRPWLDTLEKGISAHPTVSERLILEITESSAMVMPDLVSVFMADLQAKGISFALDDFGAGVTAFRHLRDFYFDLVKIDGQFSKNVHKNPDNQVLVQALVSLANHFDMFTVCESVETPDEAAFLAACGVDCLQGYHFAAPTVRPPWRPMVQEAAAG